MNGSLIAPIALRALGAFAALLAFAAFATAVPSAHAATFMKDVEYGAAGGERLLLDASVPDGAGPFPMAILIHGGGWSSGDKSGSNRPGDGADISPWFAPLTEAHYAWFSINYRLAPKNRWPAGFDDVIAAVSWVRANAARFKGDPSRTVLFGHSAGGHLAALAGTLKAGELQLKAVVGFAPVTDFEYELPARGGLSTSLQQLLDRPREVTAESLAMLREMAPINHVVPGLPPFLIVQGTADRTVPFQESLNFQAKMKAAGNTCDLIPVDGGPHALLAYIRFNPGYREQYLGWLAKKLDIAPPPALAPVPPPPPDPPRRKSTASAQGGSPATPSPAAPAGAPAVPN